MPNKRAPAGAVYLCGTCGKRSRDAYGFDKIDGGFDESCMLNAVLVSEDSIKRNPAGRVVYAEAWKEVARGEEEGA